MTTAAPPKILFYTDTPLYGGAEKQLLILAKHLKKDRFQPVIAARQSPELQNWLEQLSKNGIETHIFRTRSKNSPANYFLLSRLIRHLRPALIHAQIWNPVAGKYAYLAAWRRHIPLIITEHDPFPLKGYKKMLKSLLIKIPAEIITVSRANQQLMSELYPRVTTKISTVHNGIEKSNIALTELQIQRLKKEVMRAGPDTTIVFSAGALHPRKGFKHLIAAFGKISDKFGNIKLVIAGSGPEKVSLEKLIKNLGLDKKIVLLGQRDDIDKLMRASDIFVLPSLKEAFGLVIPEAMQAGLPVIASRVGGIPEIISHPGQGLLVSPGNKNELIKAMTKLLNDAALRQKLKQAGLSRWQDFSAENMARNTELLYDQILKIQP